MLPTISLSGDPRPSHLQPPTTIVTGKGLRSAAVKDEIPQGHAPKKSSTANTVGAEIDLSALATGDPASMRLIVTAAAEFGEFQIDGGGVVSSEEVKSVVEKGEAVFNSIAARRTGLVSRFGIGDEICWYRSKKKEMEPVLEDMPAHTYRAFRERMEVMAAKLEMVADCISYILCENVKDVNRRKRPPKMQSVLCLRKHRINRFKEFNEEHRHSWKGSGRCLSIHLPIPSSSFSSNSILVSIGEQMKEWCNGEYKSSTADKKFESDALFSIEFIMFSVQESSSSPGFTMKTISISNQLLALILIAILLKMLEFS